MKIIVSIKQVPVRDSQLRIDANGRWIQENDLSFEINEPDAYALEEALQLKEKHGGEVVAVLAGPERGSQTIREALAKGADRALHRPFVKRWRKGPIAPSTSKKKISTRSIRWGSRSCWPKRPKRRSRTWCLQVCSPTILDTGRRAS
jgi:hypothetical protein